ncbi:MAG: hypothetical protein DRP57_04615 [Spirochaetes bacterium]|nr:MAG: hypothetical protein DRP57_04615 [Spirochaetota bacterium]
MGLVESFCLECIELKASVKDKADVLHLISSLAAGSEALKGIDKGTVFNALKEREELGTTAFGNYIAIPHCSIKGIKTFIVGAVTVPGGVDFNSLDKKPTKLFVFIVGPPENKNEHIRLLSAVSKILSSAGALDEILASENRDTFRERFLRYYMPQPEKKEKDKVFFHVFVQKREYWDDILQIFSSVEDSYLTVIETNNASYYLQKLPLFSEFWTESNKGFSRIILAVVDKGMGNDIIRRINLLVDNLDNKTGILVTVQELTYTGGSLDF